MSSLPNLELRKELRELTGWVSDDIDPETNSLIAYDLGFLLRKLPSAPRWQEIKFSFMGNLWAVKFRDTYIHADSPENAAADLCIALIKQGILKVEGKK